MRARETSVSGILLLCSVSTKKERKEGKRKERGKEGRREGLPRKR
jgi:hypothetical protein